MIASRVRNRPVLRFARRVTLLSRRVRALRFALALPPAFALLASIAGCSQADNVVPAWDAQVRVNLAYEVKLDQCDQGRTFLLLVPFDVQDPDVRLCENELLAAECPVESIPASCALLFFKQAPQPDVDGF